MADRPFIAVIPIVLTANGEGSGEYDVGQGNVLRIERILQKSEGSADIIDMSDSFGNKYGNMSSDKPLDVSYFTDIASDNNNPANLPNPIVIENNGKLQFRLKDTSGAGNTVYLYLHGFLSQ